MADIAISVNNLGKRYRLGQMEPYRTLRDSIMSTGRRLFHKLAKPQQPKDDPQDFWALKDVSFEVKQGEVVGIIGRNGAGKSTLLKILSRITEPTTGRAELFGRVGSLLEVGTGFHPELTGRENIYLNGAILGMTRAEIKSKFDEIVAFSEVEKFIDTPVKRYSSGMYVRLAFAVAAHLEPEILIVDEVLAVGDAEFQKKCLGKMSGVAKEGRTVLFVSHNMAAIRLLCQVGVLLRAGHISFAGEVETCTRMYERSSSKDVGAWERPHRAELPALGIMRVATSFSESESRLRVYVGLLSSAPHRPAFIAVDVTDAFGSSIMQAIPTIEGFIDSIHQHHDVQVIVELPPMIPGRYMVTVWVGSHNKETLDVVSQCAAFEILKSPSTDRTYPHSTSHGYIVPRSIHEYVGN